MDIGRYDPNKSHYETHSESSYNYGSTSSRSMLERGKPFVVLRELLRLVVPLDTDQNLLDDY